MKKSLFHVVTLVALTIGVILTLTHTTNYAASPTTQQQIDALNQRVTALEQQITDLHHGCEPARLQTESKRQFDMGPAEEPCG